MTYRFRIIAAILVVTISTLTAFYFFTYYIATDLVETNYAKSKNDSMKLRMEQMDSYMRDVYQKTISISVHPNTKSIINEYVKETKSDTNINSQSTLKVSQHLQNQGDMPELIDALFIYIVETNQIISSQEYRTTVEVKNTEDYEWIREGSIGLQAFVTSDMGRSDDNTIFLYAKPVYSDEGNHIGTIGISISERTLYYKLLDSKDETDEYFLIDSQGYICSSRQRVTKSQISDLIDIPWDGRNAEVGIEEYDGEKSIYATVQSGFTGLTMLSISEHALLIEDLQQTQWLFTLILAVIIIGAVFLANKTADMLNKPLKNLMYAMERVEKGDFETRAKTKEGDEFFQLNNQFNDMVVRIDELISQVVDEQKNARQSELRALQYQIKPHFMYNTLNSIKYMAIMQGNERVGKQLDAFTALLEASLNKGSDFSTLIFELRIIKDYVSLQKVRYLDCFEVKYNATPDAGMCMVPRFLLQPLVENSILHGMDTKKNDNLIVINAKIIDNMLNIEVKDNGKGMTKEQQIEVLHEGVDTNRQFNGIGVFNTKERLRLLYGEDIVFELKTEVGIGTSYIIKIPAKQQKEETEVYYD
ncbi:MAG: sensor histidine kinase [Suipraeoptans sp.]